MSSFNEFSTSKKKYTPKVEDVAKNRIDPETGNEREDREPIITKNLHEANDIPQSRERSQDRNERQNANL